MKKTCKICLVEKPLDEFYLLFLKTKTQTAKHEGRCKECRRIEGRLHKRKTYDPIAARKQQIKRRDSGRMAISFARSVLKYPEKNKARYTLHNAIATGKIIRQPCEVCGKKESQGHHEDYSKPLEVKWLCRRHHADVHLKPTPLTTIIEEITK